MNEIAPALIISLHDVSLQTKAVCRSIMADLEQAGVDRISLLVIPDHHHLGHVTEDADLCNWLSSLQQNGHELIVHGYFHQRPRAPQENFRQKFITRFYTAGEGEFLDLSETEARERMELALRQFGPFGWKTSGFIAPAWLLGASSEAAAPQAGFVYTTRLSEIIDLRDGTTTRSQSLVWSVRSRWRRIISLRWNRFLLKRLQNNPVIRVGIHPPDWQYPAIRAQILEMARSLAKQREAVTYRQWIDRRMSAV